MSEIPTKPYILRALYEWCVDNGYTPHLAVKVDAGVQVPAEYVKGGEITLNISPTAVHKLQMGNELIEFSARFGGVASTRGVPMKSAVLWLVLAPSAQLPHEPEFDLLGAPTELFGGFVSIVGDVDGDDLADVAVCASGPTEDVIRLYSGRDGRFLRALPPFSPVSTNVLGHVVEGLGDLDGDGRAELVVGDGASSAARVESGANGKTLFRFRGKPGDGFGTAVANAGDVNADGVTDVVVGALHPFGNGREYVSVFSGRDGSRIRTLRAHAPGRTRGSERFGASVAGAGDVNRDGFDDIAVGAPLGGTYVFVPGFPPFVPPHWESDRSGSVRVFSGADGALLLTVTGDRERLGLGYSVAGVGDVDGDGHADLAAGTSNAEDPGPGYARVISGRDGSTLHTWLEAEPLFQQFVSVAAAGDLDGDGRPDVLVGTRQGNGGSAFVFSGRTGVEQLRFSGGHPLTGAFAVGGGGDMNRDGIMDFAVAVPELLVGAGFVRVFHSKRP